jgi:hypothetical protein
MHRKFLAGMVLGASVMLAARGSHAQFLGPSFSSSTYVDRIVQDAVRADDHERQLHEEETLPGTGETPQAGGVFKKADQATGKPEPEESAAISPPKMKGLFRDRVYSITYEYAYKNYTVRFNDLHTNQHLVAPELHLKSQNGFSLDLSALYARSDAQDQSSNVVDADSYVLSVTPALELLGRKRDRCDLEHPQLTFLTPGVALGYRHSDTDSAFGGNPDTKSSFDALTVVPNVVLTQVVSKQALASAIAAYAYDTSASDSRDFLANDGSDGVVSLAARGDLYLPGLPLPCRRDETKAHLSATVQWKHYTQASVRSVEGDDSAEFSANLTLPIPLPKRTWTLRVGYAYEAFREDYRAHRTQLYVEGPIWRE